MRSFSNYILAGLASLLYFAHVARSDDCQSGPSSLQSRTFGKAPDMSKNPAGLFCETPWASGQVVTGIEVWATPWQVTGVLFTYSDGGQPNMMGQKCDPSTSGNDHGSLSWETTDLITSMQLGTNYAGDGLGLVHIEVAGKVLDVRTDTGCCYNGDDVDLDTGIFLGAFGQAPDFVRWFQPMFMGKSNGQNATITSLVFDDNLDDLNAKQKGIKNATLDEVYIANSNAIGSNQNQSWTFSGTSSQTYSSSISTTDESSFQFGVSPETGGAIGIPGIAKAESKLTLTFDWEWQHGRTDMTWTSATQSFSWSLLSTATSDMLMPGQAKHCMATAIQGTFDGQYTSLVQFVVYGKTYSYTQRGVFKSVSWSENVVNCETIEASAVPSNAKTLPGVSDPNAPAISATSTNTTARAIKFKA